MIKQSLLLVFSILFLFSCKKKDANVDEATAKLLGSWNWVKTTRGWSPTISPETEHYNEVMIFFSYGGYVLYRNGVLIKTGTYKTEARNPGYYLYIDNGTSLLSIQDDDHFSYGWGAADGHQFYYERQ